jgi:hypothetical protein
MGYIQHGDVLLFECDKPKNVEIVKTDVFYQGLNHQHKVRGKFRIAKSNGETFIHSKGCEIYHDEHHTIKIPEGFWNLKIVKEYDHLLEESRQVID